MAFEIVVPDSVSGGIYSRGGNWSFGLMAHSLQCDQVWIFLIRYGHFRFGYRTHGDATPKIMTYKDGGWHWPWQTNRTVAGRG